MEDYDDEYDNSDDNDDEDEEPLQQSSKNVMIDGVEENNDKID